MKFLVSLLLLALCLPALAQQDHFLYLENALGKPFYARIGDKTFSSSASGYVIIPRLNSGRINLTIGFPKNEWKPQSFMISVEGDAGYMVQLSASASWELVALHDFHKIERTTVTEAMPRAEESEKNVSVTEKPAEEKKIDSVDLGRTAKQPVPSQEAVQPVNSPVQAIKNQTDSVMSGKAMAVVKEDSGQQNQPAVTDSVKIWEPPQAKVVADQQISMPVPEEPKPVQEEPKNDKQPTPIRILKKNLQLDGYQAVYSVGPVGDTVDVEILAGNGGKVISDGQASPPEGKEKVLRKSVDEKSAPPSSLVEEGRAEQKQAVSPTSKDTDKKTLITKPVNSCQAQATMNDFLSLRKNMAAQRSEEAMTALVRRFLQRKCLSVSQVGNLVVLYLSEEGRYGFFDLTYPHVSDPAAFPQLEKQLTDPYYINRFRAMLR